MPLTGNARLDHAVRKKIKALLRGLYNHWLVQPVPDHVTMAVRKTDGDPAARSRH